jgi:D-alanyl-D-alanine carboxypeptidase/D-alanyl-D-alanine-endopeptidase (penicillin-binding protein 4)
VRKGLVAAVAAVVVAAGGASAVVLQDRSAPTEGPSPVASPYPSRTPLLTPASPGALPTTAGLQAALAPLLRNPALGPRPALSVVDVATGQAVLAVRAQAPVVPASTLKLVTAMAALTALDPDRRFVTRVVAGRPGEVVLVGAGDPSLDHAGMRSLAAQLKASGTAVSAVVVDDSLFTGARTGPGWKPTYVQHGDVAPVSALEVEGGRTSHHDGAPRLADPALAAGRELARLVGARQVTRGRAAPAGGVLASVSSMPVSDLVEGMLRRSDNDYAEALGRQVALASGRPATFEGEVAAIGAVLRRPGLLGLRDASGLSPLNRVEPAVLTGLLARAATSPRYSPLLSGLPVAGFDGTLADRFRTAAPRAAAGLVRAKTGTLDGASALAGLVTTAGGRLLAFDATANGIAVGSTVRAQRALDAVAAALAACGCVR